MFSTSTTEKKDTPGEVKYSTHLISSIHSSTIERTIINEGTCPTFIPCRMEKRKDEK